MKLQHILFFLIVAFPFFSYACAPGMQVSQSVYSELREKCEYSCSGASDCDSKTAVDYSKICGGGPFITSMSNKYPNIVQFFKSEGCEVFCPSGYSYNADSGECQAYCSEDSTWDGFTCQPKAQTQICGVTESAHPIDFFQGRKYRRESLVSVGTITPINIELFYNNHLNRQKLVSGVFPVRIGKLVDSTPAMSLEDYQKQYNTKGISTDFGQGPNQHYGGMEDYWRHSFDEVLIIGDDYYEYHPPKGGVIRFNTNGISTSYPNAKLTSVKENGVTSRYTLRLSGQARDTHIFDNEGKLTRINYPNSRYITLSYDDNNQVATLTNSEGDSVSLRYEKKYTGTIYNASGAGAYYLAGLTASNGYVATVSWENFYEGNFGRYAHLTQYTKYRGDTFISGRRFVYGDSDWPGSITKIYDQKSENTLDEVLYAAFEYDDSGRAVYSSLAEGVEAVLVDYVNTDERDVTNALGRMTKYTFKEQNNTRKLSSIDGEATSYCEAASKSIKYDTDGRIASRTDWKGTVTGYKYNASGLIVKKTESEGSDDEKVTKTVWDENLNRPLTITHPSGLAEVFTYDENGNLLSYRKTTAALVDVIDTGNDKNTDDANNYGATEGADEIVGSDTLNDIINSGAGDDVVYGGAGNDILSGENDDDHLYGEEGDDTLRGGDGADTLLGSAGNDKLYGNVGNDVLLGGEGNDTLWGNDGDDTLTGGAGDDYLYGNAGSDTYIFTRNFGDDKIYNYDSRYGENDSVQFDASVDASSAIYRKNSGEDLVISFSGSDDRLTIVNYFALEGLSKYHIKTISFTGDNSSLEFADLQQKILIATEDDDVIYGSKSLGDIVYAKGGRDKVYGLGGGDSLYGGIGDDLLYGNSGDDKLTGEAGIDLLYGGYGDDELKGGDGDDTLTGGAGTDYLHGNDGNDILLGGADNDFLYGHDGDDTLNGENGNDKLSGYAGADTYIFGAGFGSDTISNKDDNNGEYDRIQFAEDIDPDTAIYRRNSGDDLIISFSGSDDKLTVWDYFVSDGNSEYHVKSISFVWAGSNLVLPNIQQKILIATEDDDVIYGNNNLDDVIHGKAGGDELHGLGGNDTLNGDDGDDELNGGDGDDTLSGGAGTDSLYGNDGNDTLLGGADNDFLYGHDGDDTLKGGKGNDKLYGYAGADTYIFDAGFGSDTISNKDDNNGEYDRIQFAEDIDPDTAIYRRNSGDDLIISFSGSDDKLTVWDYFVSDGNSEYHIKTIVFKSSEEALYLDDIVGRVSTD